MPHAVNQLFNAADLAALRATQTTHMFDQCRVLRHSKGARLPLGDRVDVWTADADATPCGYSASSREAQDGDNIVLSDGVMRLPHTVTLHTPDRLRLTHRFGELLAAHITFEVLGVPMPGPSGLVCKVKRVTDGSDGSV